jgi:hypothetical protein
MRISSLAALALFLSPVPADAFVWPWQQAPRNHAAHHHGQAHQPLDQQHGCDQIKTGFGTMTRDTMEMFMASATQRQVASVIHCLGRDPRD